MTATTHTYVMLRTRTVYAAVQSISLVSLTYATNVMLYLVFSY